MNRLNTNISQADTRGEELESHGTRFLRSLGGGAPPDFPFKLTPI